MATASTPGYNNGQYTFEQQVFSMSWASNLSMNLTGSSEEIAAETKEMLLNLLAEPAVQELIGVWNLVWGPAVYADSFSGPKKAVNTIMIVAPEQAPQQAVIAIAGTNGASLFDWIVEDFNVGHKVPWPFASSPLNPEISAGTFYGLSKLVSIQASDSAGNPPVTAREFLATQSFTSIMVAGHSLGGALSPCYTLYLDNTRSAWDASGSVALSCLPTAGPTPGDVNFSTYYDAQLLPSTQRVWNSMDVVPHAFNTLRLGQVPDIYEPNLSSTAVSKIVASLQRWTLLLSYLNISPETQGFPSKFYTIRDLEPQHKALTDQIVNFSQKVEDALLDAEEEEETDSATGYCCSGNSSTGYVVDLVEFVIQALIQHTIGYLVYFGIEEFSTLMSEISKQSGWDLPDPQEPATRLKGMLNELKAPLLLSLNEEPSDGVKQLYSGQGPLLSAILDKVEETTRGSLAQGAQPVVFLVEEDDRFRTDSN